MSRNRLLRVVPILAILFGVSFGSGARAFAQWSAVGTPQRPAWVDASAERRLRMLSALPAMKNDLHTKANAYIGSQGPGLAVGLVLDDGLYYSEGFGFADAKRTHPPDENTIFRAGSLSKVMTGTALLTLIDDPARHMSLDDQADEDRYLPELKFVCPNFNQPCTRGSQHLDIKLSHLVSHTSGLANVMETTNAHMPAWLSDLKKSWLLFTPGDFGAYSGVAVEGVGLIEQRISGQSYVDFVGKNLFAPLGMKHSSMDQNTLPQQAVAQKWMFSAGLPANKCVDACNVGEGGCMAKAHSSAERQVCVRDKERCAADCPALKPTWWFTQSDQMLTGDDQPMLGPAGGLATTVADLGLFIKMWLSGKAPQVNGRPLLKPATINSAANSLFTSKVKPPPSCSSGRMDSNSFSYSACGTAYGFGVNWYVGDTPYLEHNGDLPGFWGSNTRVDQTHKMGATGLISTEPYPTGKPQPPGLDPSFIDSVVYGLLAAGQSADQATSWSGQVLATGVARVLYLSGKTPQQSDLGMFTPDFVTTHHLTQANVVATLTTWQNQVGHCSNFRVQEVRKSNVVAVAFSCGKSEWQTVLEVEQQSPHRISWSGAFGINFQQTKDKCLQSCSVDDGKCMGQAHSSADRQQCVGEKKACDAACNK